MAEIIETYKLGDIEVTISEARNPQKIAVTCNDGNFRSQFTIRRYEYQNYKRHMNQRIKNAYREEYNKQE